MATAGSNKGRPPSTGTATRDLRHGAEQVEDLLELEEAFHRTLVDKYFAITGQQVSDVWRTLAGTNQLQTNYRSNWRGNRQAGIAPLSFCRAYIAALGRDLTSTGSPAVGTKLADWWASQAMVEAKDALAAKLGEQIDRINAANSADREAALSKAAATKTNQQKTSVFADAFAKATERTGVDLTRPWRQLTAVDFAKPNEKSAEEDGRNFLRGEQWVPYWVARGAAVWRGEEVAALFAVAERHAYVFAEGPVGQGKSTLVRQLAAHWLDQGRPVFVLKDGSAIFHPDFPGECLSGIRPLLILDGHMLRRELPGWMAWDGAGKGATIVQTLQSREVPAQRKLAAALSPGSYAVPNVPLTKAAEYVDLIRLYDASDTNDREEALAQFIDGLVDEDGSGGLWSAAYQATRGQGLDQRIDRLVAGFFNDDDKANFYALAAVTFVNTQLEYANKFPYYLGYDLECSRELLSDIVAAYDDFSPEVVARTQAALKRFGSLLASEYLNKSESRVPLDDQANPVFQFRSPALTHSLNRWIFGGRKEDSSNERLVRWPWFAAMATAMATRRHAAKSFVALMQSLLKTFFAGLKQHPPKQSLVDASIEKLAKVIHDHAMTRKPSLPTRCRLDIRFAQALYLASKKPGRDDEDVANLQKWCQERLLAATVEGASSDVWDFAYSLISQPELSEGFTSQGQLIDQTYVANKILMDPNIKDYYKITIKIKMFEDYVDQPYFNPITALSMIDMEMMPNLHKRNDFHYTFRRICDNLRLEYHNLPKDQEDKRNLFIHGPIDKNIISSRSSLVYFLMEFVFCKSSFLEKIAAQVKKPNLSSNSMANGLANIIGFSFKGYAEIERDFGLEARNFSEEIFKRLFHDDELSTILDAATRGPAIFSKPNLGV